MAQNDLITCQNSPYVQAGELNLFKSKYFLIRIIEQFLLRNNISFHQIRDDSRQF